jgi:predicted ABC-class ATPase
VVLLDSSGKGVAQAGSGLLANNSDREITMEDFQKFAVEYKKMAQAPTRQPATLTSR